MAISLERIQVLASELKRRIILRAIPLEGFVYLDGCGYNPLHFIPSTDGAVPYKGQIWGLKRDTHTWFLNDIFLPPEFDTKHTVIRVETKPGGWFFGNPQFMVYIDGDPRYALDLNHTSFPVHSKNFSLAFCGYMNEYIPSGTRKDGYIPGGCIFNAYAEEKDPVAEQLYLDIAVPLEALSLLDENSAEYIDTLCALSSVFDRIDFRGEKEFRSSLADAQRCIDEYYASVRPLQKPVVTAVGQTHIDVAWLWTKQQVREKTIRSFLTALDLMDRYPDFTFTMSQPALYSWLKEDAPQLYERIKARVKEGRWETEGGFWVESDCNLLSGESFVRQLYYGKKFFRDEFGIQSEIVWLPDTFGLCGTLPQILVKSGIKFFSTSKLSWNERNTMPYDTFYWKGNDGRSRILAYLLTAQDRRRGEPPERLTIYNARLTVAQTFGVCDRYRPKSVNNENILLTYGYGDGGGGPTEEYLETLARLKHGVSGVPLMKSGTLRSYFGSLKNTIEGKKIPEWKGELYFEYHRGTYTAIAQIKRNNRRAEFSVLDAEIAAAAEKVLFGKDYPFEKLERYWKLVLTNQFHDVLPGSSIRQVYEETEAEYTEVFAGTRHLINEFADAVCQKLKQGRAVVFNFCDAQPAAFVVENDIYYRIENLPARGYSIDIPDKTCTVRVQKQSIENEFYFVRFDTEYRIVELYDKRYDRNLVRKGEAVNTFVVFENYPVTNDAWEIASYYREKYWNIDGIVTAEMIQEGARAGFRIVRNYHSSRIEQKIMLYSRGARIDFETKVDWFEPHTILKAEFPLDLHFDRVLCDAPYGITSREISENTSWDEARFEFCAHKFVDVSEYDYGVSLINDCKYGHDALGNILRLTLLKTSEFPFENGDCCQHIFTYSLLPHGGPLGEETLREARCLNNPPILRRTIGKEDALPQKWSIIETDCGNIVVEAVKYAEDGDGIVVRMYDALNRRRTIFIRPGFGFSSVCLCDLMENELSELIAENGGVSVLVLPYEIVSVKFRF